MTITSTWIALALAATFVVAVGLAAAAAPQNLDAPSDVGGVPADAEVTDSGLAYKVLQEGSGSRRPNRLSTVSVHYTGWLTNGTLFDSSVPTGRPATFPLNQVIGGWTEGVQLMVVGEKRRFWIPAELGYGDRGFRNIIPGGALLVFDIELVDIR